MPNDAPAPAAEVEQRLDLPDVDAATLERASYPAGRLPAALEKPGDVRSPAHGQKEPSRRHGKPVGLLRAAADPNGADGFVDPVHGQQQVQTRDRPQQSALHADPGAIRHHGILSRAPTT